MKEKVFAITGATGLLGRNLMLEILKKNADKLSNLELIIIGRDDNNSLKQRIVDILIKSDYDYIASCIDKRTLKDFIDTNMHFINSDISKKDFLNNDQVQWIKKKHIDYFFHIAALTDFRNSDIVKDNLYQVNVNGTLKILELVKVLDLNEFCYVSSAYSCGNTSGIIMPDYINFELGFRNNYECSKLLAETHVRDFCERNNIHYRVFRPSTIAGRLLEHELGCINKFDVFYSWAAFFLKMKMKMRKATSENLFSESRMDCRVLYNKEAGLNIVPVDYCAKVMYHVCINKLNGNSFHLVNSNETPHKLYIDIMLETIKLGGVEWVDSIPSNPNVIETLYYKTVGQYFSPYLLSKQMDFDTSNLDLMLHSERLQCPKVDERHFRILMEYAIKANFGLK
ncbi:SDR family oxidoreductase [Bacteroides thetaiotaomicron]|uniref:SDR family oxidoreductase n=1 Tax=Bacteroides thetaiotaomicron TaxID=818 RepID=UPI0039C0D6B3